MLITKLRIPAAAFDQLAIGRGDAAAMRVLAAGQQSRRILLVRAVIEEARHRPNEEAAAGLRAAIALIDQVQRIAPAAASAVLDYPFVGAWAERCLRRLRMDDRAGLDDVPLWVDLGHLSSIAAAVAVRAELPVRITVPSRAGIVSLPTLGRAVLTTGAAFGVAVVAGDRTGYRVEGASGAVDIPADIPADGPGWLGLRRLPLPGGMAYFDDLDPYRREHGLPACDRLDQPAFDRWLGIFVEALALLDSRLPELTAWPLAVVPLVETAAGTGANATARDSVGAMALSPPPNATSLAESIIHEHAHSKLGAVLDILTLYLPDNRRYYSPWRADPRPLSGILQGVYAFLAVAEEWLTFTRTQPPPITASLAWYEFARLRAQIAAALTTLTAAGTLTSIGRRFVGRLREQVDRLLAVRVPYQLERLADLVNEDHYLTWRLRHVQVDKDDIATLAAHWRRGDPRPDRSPATWVPSDRAPAYAEEPRHELVRHLVAGRAVEGRAADLDLIEGQLSAAADAYLAQLAANPARTEAWTGLALARTRAGHAVRVFREEPEVLRALHSYLDGAAEVDELANWLE